MIYSLDADGKRIGFDEIRHYRRPATVIAGSYRGEDAWWVYWDYPIGTLDAGNHIFVAEVHATQNGSDGWDKIIANVPRKFSVNLHVD